MKQILLFTLVLTFAITLKAQIKHGLRDDDGRHIIPRGFVINTNDGSYDLSFNSDDYLRMVRLGANYQVIRLELGKLSTFPGCTVDTDYLLKLDTLVNLGKHSGMNTVFKMTLYGLSDFKWETFWLNEYGEHQTYIDAWKIVWKRYKDEASVVGYDIVNEPRKLSMDISYNDLTTKYLVPLYRKIIDACHTINNEKYCLCQTIFMNKGEAINFNQYAEITAPIKRSNIIFAPHIYQDKKEWIKPTMLRFDKEAKMLNAPILIGEWGFPTFFITDSTMTGKLGQLNYMDFYQRTAEIFDSLGVGSIKAWFLGTKTNQNFMAGGPSTWAIFSDLQSVGNVERKYITDIIARPYPQCIAGDILSFRYDFATRSLYLHIKTDNSKGVSKLFVGANRHYPDGFTILCGDNLIMSNNPLNNKGLELISSDTNSNPSDFIWDEKNQQLTILKWPDDASELHFKLMPGVK